VTIPDAVVVAATDYPVRSHELMAALRRHLHRPPAPPAAHRPSARAHRTPHHVAGAAPERLSVQFDTLDGALTELLGT